MGIHLEAKPGQIAETVLLPGDPLRAKFIADNLLEDAVCYNNIRGMLGYTGFYKGKRVSVQGTGMGIPSISIYVSELINFYHCKNLIRIGTCGGIQPDLKLGDTLLAMTASTDSSMNLLYFNQREYAPHADFDLLRKAYDKSVSMNLSVRVGNVLTTDMFFVDDLKKEYELWMKHGVLAVEMETTALYTLAARFGCKALSILTVSDQLITDERSSAEERLTSFTNMMEIALSIVE
ncbi:MAG: purine-nucleoside phosphorylase [Bacteroidales bacterium]|nr:purine-nucleoside phosphorylase [Bacteroidales bacterium]